MAKFNEKAHTVKTTNISGHAAYALDDKLKLATQVMTSFMNEPKFYGDNTDDIISTARKVAKADGMFVAKLAIYTRTVMNMRSTSHMLCAVLSHDVKGEEYVRRTIKACVVRGDDAVEIFSAYKALFPNDAVPNSLRRGLKDAIDAMDEYSIAKYQCTSSAVKMADIIKLCHAERRPGVTDACIEGNLAKPTSWETELSAHGNNKETWEKLIAENNVPYMAALRNLRNMIAANPDNFDEILERLANKEAVAKSRQLPFRFYSAYRSVEDIASSKVLDALEDAIDASLENCPRFSGRTVIAVDSSGSMNQRLSRKSSLSCADVAALLGACAAKLSDEAWVYTFASDARKRPFTSRGGILAQMNNLRGNGGCTNMGAVFDVIDAENIDCDRIIILSDNEVNYDLMWSFRGETKTIQTKADAYRRKVGHDVWVHAADMAGYGTSQFIGKDTNIIAGWSEKIFNLIPMAESGANGLVDEVERITIP